MVVKHKFGEMIAVAAMLVVGTGVLHAQVAAAPAGGTKVGVIQIQSALAATKEGQKAAAETILAEVKKEFGGEASTKLHCRELFAGSVRSKSRRSTSG